MCNERWIRVFGQCACITVTKRAHSSPKFIAKSVIAVIMTAIYTYEQRCIVHCKSGTHIHSAVKWMLDFMTNDFLLVIFSVFISFYFNIKPFLEIHSMIVSFLSRFVLALSCTLTIIQVHFGCFSHGFSTRSFAQFYWRSNELLNYKRNDIKQVK